MPPVAPLQPLPGQHLPPQLAPTIITSDPMDPWCCFLPERKSLSLWPNASTVSLISLSDVDANSPEPEGVDWRPLSIIPEPPLAPVDEWKISTDEKSTYTTSTKSSSKHSHRISLAVLSADESTQIGDKSTLELMPVPKFRALEEKMLFMQLYRAVGNVLAVKESMWEELHTLAEKRDQTLRKYGWKDADYDLPNCRNRFEALIKRYKEYVFRYFLDTPSLLDDLTRQSYFFTQRYPGSIITMVFAIKKWVGTSRAITSSGWGIF